MSALSQAISDAITGAAADLPTTAPPTGAFGLYRHKAAQHRAAAAAILLACAEDEILIGASESLYQLAGPSPLAAVAWPDCADAAKAAKAETESARKALVHAMRKTPAKGSPQRLFADGVRLLQLGDIEGATKKQAELRKSDPFQGQLLQMRLLDADGYVTEADRLGLQLQRAKGHAAPPGAGASAPFRRVGRLGVEEPPAKLLTADAAQGYLRYLSYNDMIAEGLSFITRHRKLLAGNLHLATLAARFLLEDEGRQSANWRAIRLDAEALPAPQRINFLLQTGEVEATNLARLLRICAAQHDQWSCAAWLPLVERALVLSPAPPLANPTDRVALAALMTVGDGRIVTKHAALTAEAEAQGYKALDPAADATLFRARANFNSDALAEARAVQRSLTPRAAVFLEEAKAQNRGLAMISIHGVRMGRGNFLPAAAAALAGFDVLSVVGASGREQAKRFAADMNAFKAGGAAFNLVNRKNGPVAEQTRILLDCLGKNGAINISPDGLFTPGQKVLAPWFLRPYPVAVYASQLALAKNAIPTYVAAWPRPNGTPVVDIVPVEPPPNQGALQVRAGWLTQRIARTARQFHRDHAAPLSLTPLTNYGGRARSRTCLPLQDWRKQTGVADSLVGWLAGDAPDPALMAFKSASDHCSTAEMQTRALRMAAMLLHFQDDKPSHGLPGRRFLQQHRVFAIMPKGVGAAALALGAMAAGSLLAVSGDDLSADIQAARIRAFNPDMVIVGASAWTAVLAAAPKLARHGAIILNDSGDSQAVDDILESFEPAAALPEFRQGAPALAIFTSGSDGAPKGVVLANTMLADGTGLDRAVPLQAEDRVAYLSRWDAVGLVDVLAVMRCGATVVQPEEALLSMPSQFAEWLDTEAITLLTMPASLWRPLAASTRWQERPPSALMYGVLWGERVDLATVDSVTKDIPDLQLFVTFGSSEASYIAFGEINRAIHQSEYGGGDASPGGHPLPGVEISLDQGDDPEAFRAFQVTGANVMLGYFDDLADANHPIADSAVRSTIQADLIRMRATGAVEVAGRADSIVKVAGRRVSLIEIQAAAESVHGVTRALAFADDSGQSTRVQLAVESKFNEAVHADLRQAVADAVAARTFATARPSRLLVLHTFPHGKSGKLDRSTIREALNSPEAISVEAPLQPPPSSPEAVLRPAASGSDQSENTDSGNNTVSRLLKALEEWAYLHGKAYAGKFKPDVRPLELDSIDVMDVMLLAEEVTGAQAQSTEIFQGDGPPTWQALADALATPAKPRG